MGSSSGRVALVTGGSRGIGAAIALRLAREGADVAVTYLRSASRAAEVVDGIHALGRRGLALEVDSGDPKAVTAAVDHVAATFGRLDVLVNNAGVFPHGPIEQVGADELERTLAVHISGVFVAAQAASRHLTAGGRIISIGSCFAERVPVAGVTLYAMTKSALTGLTQGLARDLGPRGVAVTVVHPGPTDTEMNPAVSEGADEQRALTAVGRFASADEIAATVAHLAGPEGGFLTGTAVSVDGGYAA